MKLGAILVGAALLPLAALAGSLPFIGFHPTNQIVAPGGDAVFNVSSTNATAHQWRFNGMDVPWGTNAALESLSSAL